MAKQITLDYPCSLKHAPISTKYLCDMIRRKQTDYDFATRRELETDRTRPVRLNAEVLEQILGRGYAAKIKDAIKDGWLLCVSRENFPKKESRAYVLNDSLYNEEWLFGEHPARNDDTGLVKRLLSWRENRRVLQLKHLRGTPYYGVAKDLYKVRLDSAAESVILALSSEARRTQARWAYDTITNREWYHFVDKKGNRLHTPLNCVPEVLRPFLRFECKGGDNLAIVDIRNSQPLFLVLFLDEILRNTRETRQEKENLVICSAEYHNCMAGKELNALRQIVENGIFYREIESALSLDTGQGKTAFFHYAFGCPYTKAENNPARTFFEERFPQIHSFLFRWKVKNFGKESGKPYWGRLACEMQRQEARFVYQYVIPKIKDKRGVVVGTMFDSVLCRLDDCELVESSFARSFEQVGIGGKVKTEHLRADRSPLVIAV